MSPSDVHDPHPPQDIIHEVVEGDLIKGQSGRGGVLISPKGGNEGTIASEGEGDLNLFEGMDIIRKPMNQNDSILRTKSAPSEKEKVPRTNERATMEAAAGENNQSKYEYFNQI